MDDIIYVSQKEAIDRNAIKKGISLRAVVAYTNDCLEVARYAWPGESNMWHLNRVEMCTWNHFCRTSHLMSNQYTDSFQFLESLFQEKSQLLWPVLPRH